MLLIDDLGSWAREHNDTHDFLVDERRLGYYRAQAHAAESL